MNNKPLLTIYQAFRNYANSCPADETIGIRVATKFLRYCLLKHISFNHELRITELERENEKYRKHIRQLKIRIDDLENDNETLIKRNKDLDNRNKAIRNFSREDAKIFKNHEDGYNALEVNDGEGAKTKVWIQASKEQIAIHYDELAPILFKKKKTDVTKRIAHMRNVIKNHYQHKGFKVK